MKIVLKDGTEIQNAMVGKTMNFIELTMAKADAVALMTKFMDEEIMSEITHVFGVWTFVYRGYKRLNRIENPREDEMRIWMEGEEDEIESERLPRFDEMYMPKTEG